MEESNNSKTGLCIICLVLSDSTIRFNLNFTMPIKNSLAETNDTRTEDVLNSSQFKQLVSSRWSISLILSVLMLSVYFGFILTIAFNKEILARKIGAHITWGLPVGIGIILFAWLLTGIYVWWANTYYDKQVDAIKDQFNK